MGRAIHWPTGAPADGGGVPIEMLIVDNDLLRELEEEKAWEALAQINTTFVDNLRNVFRGESSFNGAIGSWDVSGVTTMRKLFQGASSFDQDLSSWDVDQVTDCLDFATGAGLGASFLPKFTSCTLLMEEEEDTETEPSNPFPQTKDCHGQPIPIDADCPPPTTPTKNCNGQQIPIDQPCTTQPRTKECHGRQIPISDACPDLLVIDANGITVIIDPDLANPSQYVGQTAIIDGIPYTIVDNASIKRKVREDMALCTTLVTDMSHLFNGRSSFNDDIGDWDVSSVTNMTGMFFRATSFNQDISEWDVDQVTACAQATCVLSANRRPNFSNCSQPCL
ncbi:MAG: BspA family leucine-rich repeat surface protein [Flavobacteriaceae bacterium]|nr:BspA family leucine-rich repeat surface protein [Flavobacteriaceae bacterium]MCY4266274.1 BspA family leucine-rich repeat surface protein [Flavobacteriaceae bacterium]